jgi:hypothetical protein
MGCHNFTRDAAVQRAGDGDSKVETHASNVGLVLEAEVHASGAVVLNSQPERLGGQRMPILPSRTTLGVHSIRPKGRRERHVIAYVAFGVAPCHIAMRIGGALLRPDYADARKRLVAINDALRPAHLQLVPIRVEYAARQGLGVQQRNNVRRHEGVEEVMELASPATILERGQ